MRALFKLAMFGYILYGSACVLFIFWCKLVFAFGNTAAQCSIIDLDMPFFNGILWALVFIVNYNTDYE